MCGRGGEGGRGGEVDETPAARAHLPRPLVLPVLPPPSHPPLLAHDATSPSRGMMMAGERRSALAGHRRASEHRGRGRGRTLVVVGHARGVEDASRGGREVRSGGRCAGRRGEPRGRRRRRGRRGGAATGHTRATASSKARSRTFAHVGTGSRSCPSQSSRRKEARTRSSRSRRSSTLGPLDDERQRHCT